MKMFVALAFALAVFPKLSAQTLYVNVQVSVLRDSTPVDRWEGVSSCADNFCPTMVYFERRNSVDRFEKWCSPTLLLSIPANNNGITWACPGTGPWSIQVNIALVNADRTPITSSAVVGVNLTPGFLNASIVTRERVAAVAVAKRDHGPDRYIARRRGLSGYNTRLIQPLPDEFVL